MLCLNESYSYVWLVMRWGLPSSSGLSVHEYVTASLGHQQGVLKLSRTQTILCQLTRHCMYTLLKITLNPPVQVYTYCICVYRTCSIKRRESNIPVRGIYWNMGPAISLWTCVSGMRVGWVSCGWNVGEVWMRFGWEWVRCRWGVEEENS